MYLIILTEEQQLELNRRAHAQGIVPRTRDRLEMVRLSDAGWSVPRIAKHLGGDERKARRWIKTYLSGGFDALVDKPHARRRSALTEEMVCGIRTEVEKRERTWTVRQMGEWVLEQYGVSLSEERLRLRVKRAGLTWQRTSRNLKHKQKPEDVARGRATLKTLEKGGTKG